MISFTSHAYRREWLGNARADLLSGLVVALRVEPRGFHIDHKAKTQRGARRG